MVTQANAPAYHRSDDADTYKKNASFVYNPENTRAVLELLDPKPGEKILDVGCGTGELTRQLHALVSSSGDGGCVVGTDLSANMISAARKRGNDEGINPRVEVVDGHDLESWLEKQGLVGTFDKVFSNAALHWMKADPAAVVRGMSRALRPGGILVLEMGGHLNIVGLRSALHVALAQHGIDAATVDPWYFPTLASYSNLLLSNGFGSVPEARLVPRPTPLPRPAGLAGFLETFAGPFLNALPDDKARNDVVQRVIKQLKVDMYDAEEDQWTAMNCRLRVRAIKA
ncbi:S-adenosyl-L-methionine-dependent methyltransferase [Acaromyces ingoldii]|uniref:S-adenosyl-L-methionine-dependent methyltransferase n=1 Tax=Acaromyces ingoldii TaxID=215250 RepID=A0A316YQ01_9BASI|nr:S-adenosyl-L-methionine-dependent methyltransferase [Acaromyces ingoldii]PWN90738.1 S-adenosyl-L-methionine-dependent methyltransferase [Acaromyces ingoldii]